MGLRQDLALWLAPDLQKVLGHVETALAELGQVTAVTPSPVAHAVEELMAAQAMLRGGPPPVHH